MHGSSRIKVRVDLPSSSIKDEGTELVPGLNLLEASIAEYQHRDLSSRHLARQLYIHSMTYLLKGLPSDLTPEEIITLQAACPSSLISTSNTPFSYLSSTHWPDADESAPSLLHRLLAITIVQVFILSSFIWPYLKMLGEKIYVYEREHRLSERALNATVDGLNQVGKRSVSVGTVLFRTGNGKVATMAASGVAWWVQSVAGGVTEGVEEGMAAVGKAEKSKEKDTERKIQSSGETRGTISTAKYR
ncbi:hypothetical protein MMC25_007516 [Agyrium rufum]|nr:hypothetical protein [Agyrium rufum]